MFGLPQTEVNIAKEPLMTVKILPKEKDPTNTDLAKRKVSMMPRLEEDIARFLPQDTVQKYLSALSIPAWCPSVPALLPTLPGSYYACAAGLLPVKLLVGTFNIRDPCAVKLQSKLRFLQEKDSRAAKISIKTREMAMRSLL